MRERIVFVTSDLYYVNAFLARQIMLASDKYEVTLIVNGDTKLAADAINNCGHVRNFSISRKIALFADVLSLFRLVWFFIMYRPAIVHSTTPKAGLLAMVAARITGVKFRLHTFTGQVWQTRVGLLRRILILTDRITSACSSFVLADSHSQRQLLLEHEIVCAERSGVIGQGSICGVNPIRFARDEGRRLEMRRSLGVPGESVVILYMARFTVDKGALLMASAYARLCGAGDPNIYLLMVGPDEEHLTPEIADLLRNATGKYALINYTATPEYFFQCADVFCLPSFREGFPMVLLNAAACEVPVVASDIYGCSDAVVDGVTGSLFRPGDVGELCASIGTLIASPDTRAQMGRAARARVEMYFTEERVNSDLMRLYEEKTMRMLNV